MRPYPNYAKYCGLDGTVLSESNGFEPDPSSGASAATVEERGAVVPKAVAPKKQESPPGGKPQPQPEAAKPQPPKTHPTKHVEQEKPYAAGEGLSIRDTIALEQLAGKTLDGKYRIERALAEGGMAILYLAHHVQMERQVVVKVIHDSLMYRQDMIERFKRECKMEARFNHPNIVSVYDFGFINDSQPYLVMEYVRGKSLSHMLIEGGQFPVPMATRILLQACSGLEEAHSSGIVHRDLKPDNIILQDKKDRPDWVKIVDFGIATLLDNSNEKRLTRVGVVIGTPEYMSPEQFMGKPLDARTDIYALGIVLFEMLTGHVPFESPAYDVLMAKHLMDATPSLNQFRPDIPVGSSMDQIIGKCLAKSPDARFQSATALRQQLEVSMPAGPLP
jgi:serine/threonine-protein kinase